MMIIAVFIGTLATSGLAPVNTVSLRSLSLKRPRSTDQKLEQDVDREDANINTLYDQNREAAEEQAELSDDIEQDFAATSFSRAWD